MSIWRELAEAKTFNANHTKRPYPVCRPVRAFNKTTNIMNWIDTNTLIAICTCSIGLTQFLLWRYIAKNKAYESEKGKNLATKEDIGEITKKVETIKNIYSSYLEKYKLELQKEFESSKYIIKLCNSLDDELVKLASNYIQFFSSEEDVTDLENDKNLILATIKIYIFLEAHSVRYIHNSEINSLYYISRRIKQNYENNKFTMNILPADEQVAMFNANSKVLALFLPKLKLTLIE